jgi:hypothetical protein
MLTKSQEALLARLDKDAETALAKGFDSGAAHWQHVRAIARNGVTADELHAYFRGAWDDDVVEALIASRATPETIEA